ncbi:chemosensory receptor c [Plakobranchus ocellatus]|uniref:Chemosensory receptor c n=1 Tax=Plakobranchus ocellatus TaxID=259542 RepID=A0AAV3ZHY3_9GAST|nr:chemosensory receptor c [Plakobranchus ocellatus]
MEMNDSSILKIPLRRQIVADELFAYVNALSCFTILIFSIPSIFFNAINIAIFFKIGVSDSITVCFLYLALCDFCSMILTTLSASFQVLYVLGATSSKNFPIYSFNAALFYGLPLSLAAATTTYIAVQRGLCVAWPFLTRHAFTRNRSLIVLIVISIILFVCWLPRAAAYRNVYMPDPAMNSSQILIVQFLGTWSPADSFYLISVRIALVFVQYMVMSVCAVAIAVGMRSSMKLKSATTTSFDNRSNSQNSENAAVKENGSVSMEVKNVNTDLKSAPKRGSDKKIQQKVTKEMQVIKQAFVVVLVYVICTTPTIPTVIYRLVEPKFQVGADYSNLMYVVFGLLNATEAVNAFINFFIYLNFNSKFRNCFGTVFNLRYFINSETATGVFKK